MANIDVLKALLEVDESGEQIAAFINELLIDEQKRELLIVKLNEAQKETLTLRQEVRLHKSEEVVKELVLSSGRPLTAQDVSNVAPEYLPSLKHRSHTSSVLNSLVSKGVLGKLPLGNVVYFGNPEEAVLEQLKRRDESPTDCSPDEIGKETGLPLARVLDVLQELAR